MLIFLLNYQARYRPSDGVGWSLGGKAQDHSDLCFGGKAKISLQSLRSALIFHRALYETHSVNNRSK